jgi:HEAT repeat protein
LVAQQSIGDPDRQVRQTAANTLSRFTVAAKPAVPLLADLLRDKEVKVRRAAAGALLTLGAVSKEALPALMKAMKDSDKLVRIWAATAVAGLGEDYDKVSRLLLEFSTDSDKDVRSEAAGVFAYMGARAIPILKDGLKSKSPLVRAWTVRAFIAIMRKDSERARFPSDTITLLINAIGDENKKVATSAIYAVSRLGFRAKDAVPALIKRFKDPDWQCRVYAVMHVEEFGPASELAIPALKDALKDENASVREAAKRALAAIHKAMKGTRHPSDFP